MWLVFWTTHFLAYNVCCALRFIMLDVPSPTISGESIELTCSYELTKGKDKLYSVKWYKNDEEFYRFVPQDWPPAQFLPMPGIKVDLSRSDQRSVYLKNINIHSTGIYRCEVSTDAPDFTTIEESKEMEVFVLPNEGPKIHGSKSKYEVGDDVSLNCTSSKSKPASILRWSINDKSIDPSNEIQYPIAYHLDGLETTTLGLKFQVDEHHFQSGNMKLKCTAIIKKFYTMSNEALFSDGQSTSGNIVSENLNQEPSCAPFTKQVLISWQIIYSLMITLLINDVFKLLEI